MPCAQKNDAKNPFDILNLDAAFMEALDHTSTYLGAGDYQTGEVEAALCRSARDPSSGSCDTARYCGRAGTRTSYGAALRAGSPLLRHAPSAALRAQCLLGALRALVRITRQQAERFSPLELLD